MASDPGVVERLVLLVEGGVQEGVDQLPDWLSSLAALAAAAAAAVAAVTLEAAAYADEAIKAARGAELQVETYTALRYAADLAGLAMEDLSGAQGAFLAQLDGAGRGSQESIDLLARVGLTYEQATAAGVDFADLLPQIIDGLAAIESPMERAATRNRLLGESSKRMASLIAGGGDALREAMQEAERYGIVISEEAAVASEKLNDDLSRLRARARGLALTFGLELVPAADRLVEAMGDILDRWQPRIFDAARFAAHSLEAAITAIPGPARTAIAVLGPFGLAGALARMVAVSDFANKKIPFLGNSIVGLTKNVGNATKAAAPWLAALAAVVLVLDDLRAYMEGADSYIGDFASYMDVDSDLYAATMSVWELLSELAGLLGDTFDAALAAAGDALDALADKFTFLRPIVDGVKEAIQSILDFDFSTLLQSIAFAAQYLRLGAANARASVAGDQGPRLAAAPGEEVTLALDRVRELQREREAAGITPQGPAAPVTVNVNGAQDPEATARAVKRELDRQVGENYGQVGGR